MTWADLAFAEGKGGEFGRRQEEQAEKCRSERQLATNRLIKQQQTSKFLLGMEVC